MNTLNTKQALSILLNYNTSDETKTYLNKTFESHDPEKIIYCDELEADRNSDIMKQVIGTSGRYFKLTTKNYGVEFIWYNIEKNKIEFYGYNVNNIENAKQFILMRIKMINNRMNAQKLEINS